MNLHHLYIVSLLLLGSADLSLMNSCSTVQQQQAATMGGIQGAATGAVIGSRNNNSIEGAVIGGVIGATTGAILASPQAGPQPIQLQADGQE